MGFKGSKLHGRVSMISGLLGSNLVVILYGDVPLMFRNVLMKITEVNLSFNTSFASSRSRSVYNLIWAKDYNASIKLKRVFYRSK